jgi:hypothetical protein
MKKKSTSESGLFNPRIFLAFVLCFTGALLAVVAFATTTPSSGTLTDSGGPLTFAGGPYLVPNPSSQATGTPTCNSLLPCDEYALTVSGLSPATTASRYIRVEVRWPELGEAQFDLYVFSGTTATGTLIAKSLGNQTYVDPDVVLIPAINGLYTLRIVPFNPQGLSITGMISLVPFPPVAPIDPGVPPTFSNHVSPPGSFGNDAGEPSIGVDWNPNVPSLTHDQVNTGGVAMFTSGTEQLRVNFDDATSPPTVLWEDMAAPIVTGLDPIGFVDHQTGRIFALELAVGDSSAAFSDNDGNSWTPFNAGGFPAGPDHETLGGGPYNEAAVPPPPPHPLYPNAIYYCSQNIAGGAECSRSDNGGVTFGPGVDIFDPVECYGGIHGHAKVGPNGFVYVPNSSCSAGTGSQGVAVSRDNGLTWVDYTVPNSVGSGDPSVGIGSDNTLYLGYVNGDGRPHVAVSTDYGTTWINDYEVGTPVGCAPGDQYAPCRIKSAVFPTVVAGDGDRAAFGFLGSTTGGNFQDQATFQGIWNFYVATTYDRGAHWVTVNATEGDPVQKGSICLLGFICGNDRNLLDFNDISVDKQGRSIAAYADGCVAPGCGAANNYEGRDSKAAVVRQLSGRRLFAAFDPPQPTPTPTATPGATPTPQPTTTPTPVISISGTVVYCSNPIPGPVPGVTLTLTGSASGSTLSDGSGNYTFSSLPSGGTYIVTPTKASRTPGSAGINTIDVIATQQHFLNLGTPLAGCRLMAANVNGDTSVNTVDVVAIQRFFLGLSTGIANTGQYKFTPASRTYTGISSDQTSQNYDTLVFGDVASSFVEM